MRVRTLALGTLLAAWSSVAPAAWQAAKSKHFIIYSEGGQSSLIETAKELEKFEFLLRAVSNSKDSAGQVPVKVYLMPNRRAVQSTMGLGGGGGVAGYYFATSRGPIAVATRFDSDKFTPGITRVGGMIGDGLPSQTVLLHEYTHHFMFQHFPAAYPSWYSEGFAEYYGTTRFLENDVIEVGHIAPHRLMSFDSNRWLPLNRVLTAQSYSDIREDIDLLYAEGWLLVHYLGNAPQRKGQLARYLDLLNSGAEYKDAMDRAFGNGARELDSELRAYLRKGRLNAVRLPFKPIDVGPIAVRSLSPAEEALIDSDITLGRGVFVSEAKDFASSVRRIAARYPQDPYALSILAEAERAAGNRNAAASAADAWLSVSPNSGSAKLMKARIMIDSLSDAHSTDAQAWDAARSLILQANKLSPTDPAVYEAYYDSFIAQGTPPPVSAQNALVRAFELVPQDEDIRFKLAADFESRDMLEDAIVIIKPIAMEAHDPAGEPEGKRAKRKRDEAKYRVVGNTVNEDGPREMLARLEAKLAAKRR